MKKCPVPANTMLDRYSTDGAYTDCYQTEVPVPIAFPDFIFTFYTTPLFKLERFILKLLVAKPSTDLQARALAEGSCNKFAAWHVEGRSENEILMCDFRGCTRSWLMVVPLNASRTKIYFGSAVVQIRDKRTGKQSLGFGFKSLLGFHKIYSVLLLHFARANIKRQLSKSL
jgi:hypothetical protein